MRRRPLPADAAALAALRGAIGDRPVFLAASTQPGEEAIVAAAHRLLAAAQPGLLTIIVPAPSGARPGDRRRAGRRCWPPWRCVRPAAGRLPGPDCAIYVADTLGELGLFYRLAGVCLVGGSLVPHGGQNPREPARLGCPILLGPHTHNFEEPVGRLLAAGGARRVAADPAALAAAAGAVLSNPDCGRAMANAAAAALAAEAGLPDLLAGLLIGLLPGAGPGDGARTPSPADPAAAPVRPTHPGGGR